MPMSSPQITRMFGPSPSGILCSSCVACRLSDECAVSGGDCLHPRGMTAIGRPFWILSSMTPRDRLLHSVGRRVTDPAEALAQQVIDRVVIDAILNKVDMNALLEHVDVNALLENVDLNALVDKLDVNAIVAKVDI